MKKTEETPRITVLTTTLPPWIPQDEVAPAEAQSSSEELTNDMAWHYLLWTFGKIGHFLL